MSVLRLLALLALALTARGAPSGALPGVTRRAGGEGMKFTSSHRAIRRRQDPPLEPSEPAACAPHPPHLTPPRLLPRRAPAPDVASSDEAPSPAGLSPPSHDVVVDVPPSALSISGGANLLSAFWRFHGTSVKFLIAGAAAGVVSRTCTSPLEVIATMQMCGVGSSKPSVIVQLKELFAEEGWAGLWKGNGANCLKVPGGVWAGGGLGCG